MRKDLVVLSMDFIWTLVLGVMGELACFMGLKLRIAEMILLAMDCRVAMAIPRQFNVALTSMASLQSTQSGNVAHVYSSSHIPLVFMKDVEESIQQARRLSFKERGWD